MFRFISIWVIATVLFHPSSYGQFSTSTLSHEKVLQPKGSDSAHKDSSTSIIRQRTPNSNLEIPKTNPNDIIVAHLGFTLAYSEEHEQSSWVAYELTKEETRSRVSRSNKFIADPKVKTGTATDKDYAGSGYDRGHLAPAADMCWSEESMMESFYYSNMSPQVPDFNRGVCKKLEELVRTWAIEYNSVLIVTGPVLTPDLPSIGPENVTVPNYYYKVILDNNQPNMKGIGFILPNKSCSESLQAFAVSIDSVEHLTGIDFFPMLPDIQEDKIEKNFCIDCWIWKREKISPEKGGSEPSAVHHCKAIMIYGEHCTNLTSKAGGFCDLHNVQATIPAQPIKESKMSASVQCISNTKSGYRCSRMTYSPNGRCFQHGGQ